MDFEREGDDVNHQLLNIETSLLRIEGLLRAFIVLAEAAAIPPPTIRVVAPEILGKDLNEIDFSTRTASALQGWSASCSAPAIRTLGELSSLTARELLKRRGFGKKSLREVQETLGEFGLQLGMKHEASK